MNKREQFEGAIIFQPMHKATEILALPNCSLCPQKDFGL